MADWSLSMENPEPLYYYHVEESYLEQEYLHQIIKWVSTNLYYAIAILKFISDSSQCCPNIKIFAILNKTLHFFIPL